MTKLIPEILPWVRSDSKEVISGEVEEVMDSDEERDLEEDSMVGEGKVSGEDLVSIEMSLTNPFQMISIWDRKL